MQSQNRILDDLAKLLTSAAGAAQGVRKEIETLVRQQAERWLLELDLVPREEFEAVREMAVLAREENAALEKRVSELEKKLAASSSRSAAKAKTAKAKTASRAGKSRAPSKKEADG